MPRQPSGQIREHTDVHGVVSYSVRFRGRGYPTETIRLGRSDEGMRWLNRAGQGPWSGCAQAPAVPPAGPPGQPVVPPA
jgi:hypothetical protein